MDQRTTHRPRHAVGPRVLKLLSPWFRYSDERRAFVLRLTSRHGPVLVQKEQSRR